VPRATASRCLGVAAGALALAATLTSCSSSGTGPHGLRGPRGPLGPVEADGAACIAQLDHGVLTNGWPFVENSSRTPAVIDKVGVANAHGLKLLGAVAVPTTEDFYGAQAGYPNNSVPLPGFRWQQRRNAVGDAIPFSPADSHKWTDLLFILRLTASHGSLSGVDIWYTDGGQHYHLRTVFGLYVMSCPGRSPSPASG
jgi:hypothetical protein